MGNDLIESSTTVTSLIRKTQKGDLDWQPVYSSSTSEVWSAQDGETTVILSTGQKPLKVPRHKHRKSGKSTRPISAYARLKGQPTVIIKNKKDHTQKKIEYFPAIKDLLYTVRKST